MNKLNLRQPTIFGALLLATLFLAFSPANASAGNFPVVVSGGDITIKEGETIARTVVVGNPDGYTGNIQIHAARADMPPGVNITFNPDTGIISTGMSFQTTATFKADGLVLAGSYKYIIGVTPPGLNLEYGTATKLNMTTLNKVNPAKAMSSTVNTIRASATKMIGLRLELPDPNPGDSFTAFVGNNVFAVKSWTNPVLIMDRNYGLGGTGARWFSLADPMNPTRDMSKDTGISYWYCGDAGGPHYSLSSSYSRDGGYLVGNYHNCGGQASTPEYRNSGFEGYLRPSDVITFNTERNDRLDMFESKTASNSHVYYTSARGRYGLGGGGITRLDGITKVAGDWVFPDLPATAPNIPTGTGSTGVMTTVMAGATDYVAVLTGPLVSYVLNPNKLSIYSPTENNPVAEINLTAATPRLLTSFVTSDVKYVMFITSRWITPSSLGQYDPKRWENLLYVYKFDPAANALTAVVEGIKVVGELGPGNQMAMTGVRIGNKDGVMMLLHDDMAKDDPVSPTYGRPFWKPKVFMFSDLSAGRLTDVFTDAGYSIMPNYLGDAHGPFIASLNKGDTTYVYLNTQGSCEGVNTGTITSCTGVAVMKFDPSGVNVGSAPSTQHKACVSNSCVLVNGAGADSCTGDTVCTGATPSNNGGGGAPAGSCDFTLTPTPASIDKTVPTGQSSYISIGLASTKPADTTCPAITLSLTTLRDASGNTVATPLSSSLTISPGNSTVAIYNVSKYPGSYTLPIKAYGRGVQKTVNVGLIVQ